MAGTYFPAFRRCTCGRHEVISLLMKYGNSWWLMLGLCAFFAGECVQAQICDYTSIETSAPARRYIDNGDGTATDKRTGLQWKRCSEGQTWTGRTCTGLATVFNSFFDGWKQALQLASSTVYAGKSDWRVPNVKELASIIEQACYGPALDLAVFPDNSTGLPIGHVSSTTDAGTLDLVEWSVALAGDGNIGTSSGSNYLRLVRSGPAPGAMNDTGQDWWSGRLTNYLTSEPAAYPGQDASHGRDARAADDADGHAGFSFTKLDAGGDPLRPSARTWSCVQDEVTGLVWEAKTDNGGRHDKDWSYYWYNPDPFINGGSAGTADSTLFPSNRCFDRGRCDTDKLVADVNAEGLCGFSDWRLPSRTELRSIVDFGTRMPAVDTAYFPNTMTPTTTDFGFYWTAAPSAAWTGWIYGVSFADGAEAPQRNTGMQHVRLVRGRSSKATLGPHLIGVWRPSTGRFYLDMDGSQTWTPRVDAITDSFGVRSDLPVAGDWNGDGFDEIGVWRPGTGRFYLDIDGTFTWRTGIDLVTDPFGARDDRPVAGDWNGDGTDEIGMWRPSTGCFYLDMDGNGTWTRSADKITAPFGAPNDYPVVGDWNGDGVDDVGVWRPSTGRFYLDVDGSFTWTRGVDVITDAFGIPGDIPVAGDWNDDGKDDIGVWRPSSGRFYLDSDGSFTWTPRVDAITASFGLPTDLPVVGRW